MRRKVDVLDTLYLLDLACKVCLGLLNEVCQSGCKYKLQLTIG